MTELNAAFYYAVAEATAATFPVAEDEDHPELGPRAVPSELRRYLARLRLLEAVPFSYLVADSAMLPVESIRFFYLDRGWTDALVQGALSVGTVSSADRAQLERLYRVVRDEVDQEERLVRLPGGERVQQGPAGPISGFLLRSRIVSGWPGLHVRAYSEELGGPDDAVIPESDPRRLKLLRLERLAPAVLLALFDGTPEVVHVEEPRQGIQFGVNLATDGDPNRFSATVRARDATTGLDLAPPGDPAGDVAVPFRPGSPGVVDVATLAARLRAKPGTNLPAEVDSGDMALQLIRFPYRQVFGDPSVTDPTPIGEVFRPSVSLGDLRVSFREVLES